MSPPNDSTGTPFLTQVRQLAATSQFYWYISHVSAIWFMTWAVIGSMTAGNRSPRAIGNYQWSIGSIIVTYLIVIRQTYKGQSISVLFSQPTKLVRDENIQYLVLAILLRLFSSPVYGGVNTITLQPFCIFAMFHSLQYFRNNLLPFISVIEPSTRQQVSSKITSFVKNYHETCLTIAANMELLVGLSYSFELLRMLLFFQLLQPSYFVQNLKTVVLWAAYIVFNKFRYEENRYTQGLVNNYDTKLCQVLYNDRLPAPLRNAFQRARQLFISGVSQIKLPSRIQPSRPVQATPKQ